MAGGKDIWRASPTQWDVSFRKLWEIMKKLVYYSSEAELQRARHDLTAKTTILKGGGGKNRQQALTQSHRNFNAFTEAAASAAVRMIGHAKPVSLLCFRGAQEDGVSQH